MEALSEPMIMFRPAFLVVILALPLSPPARLDMRVSATLSAVSASLSTELELWPPKPERAGTPAGEVVPLPLGSYPASR